MIKNCPRCKKIFTPLNNNLLCPNCIKEEEDEFQRVRNYVRENRGVDIHLTSEATQVSVKKIIRYLREGRLEVTEGMQDFLKCEKCGVPIRTGRFCKNCMDKMSEGLTSMLVMPKTDDQPTAKMHLKRK